MADLQQSVAQVRGFNRFYTRQIGVLNEGFLQSPFSLTEVRVLFELSVRGTCSASDLRRELGIDAGYLSRILRSFHRRGLVRKQAAARDARRTELSLSSKGRSEFGRLEARQRSDVERMLGGLSPRSRKQLVDRMHSVERILSTDSARHVPDHVTLRGHRPGDMGWITHRQAVLYDQEYGWGERYEALIARIMAEFVQKFDARWERCWVAERAGEIVGSIFCVRKSRAVARLRLLYVEPAARGLGLGTRLVDECVAFARSHGYRTLTLWTNSVLHDARRIYERKGFVLVHEKPHKLFGRGLVGQTWELNLRSSG
jgi:DNA-binding MarR family transcriptional regulator/GNAT superfamily N-acetyltransferase